MPGNSTSERVADAYSRGEFCLGAGKDDEAIAAKRANTQRKGTVPELRAGAGA